MPITNINQVIADIYLNGKYYNDIPLASKQSICAHAEHKQYIKVFHDRVNNITVTFNQNNILKIINTPNNAVNTLTPSEYEYWKLNINSGFFLGLFTAFKLALEYRASDKQYCYLVSIPPGFYPDVKGNRSQMFTGKQLISIYYTII